MSDRARYWSGLVESWARSGLSQAEFCRRRGVNGGTFAWWKRQLRAGAHDGPTLGGRRRKMPERSDCERTAERFIEVRLPSAVPAYEVVLPGGRSIRVGGQFDPEVLSRLITAVESC